MTSSDFWSRRRAAVAAEQAADDRAKERAEVETEQQALQEKSDQEILADLNLPDPETMQPGDDFSAFMKAAVPERLRRRALRQLWATNPVLANLDGLVEYGEDYTDAATVIENLTTAYQVGKGMSKHVEEMLRQANGPEDAPDLDAAEGETGPDDMALEESDEPMVTPAGSTGKPEENSQENYSQNHDFHEKNDGDFLEKPEDSPRKPGRMRYTFKTEA